MSDNQPPPDGFSFNNGRIFFVMPVESLSDFENFDPSCYVPESLMAVVERLVWGKYINDCQAVKSADEKCGICMDEEERDLLKTPCNHIFCRNCLEGWVMREMRDNCPLCRGEFQFANPVISRHPSILSIDTALFDSKLFAITTEEFGHVPYNLFGRTLADLGLTRGIPGTTVVDAYRFHRHNIDAQGPGRIVFRDIAPFVIAKAHLAQCHARRLGGGFTDAESEQWARLVRSILSQLRAMDRTIWPLLEGIPTLNLPTRLAKYMLDNLCDILGGDIGAYQFLSIKWTPPQNTPKCFKLTALLDYVAYRAMVEYKIRGDFGEEAAAP